MWRTAEGDDYLRAEYNQGRKSTRQLAAEFDVKLGALMRRARKLGLTSVQRERVAARAQRASTQNVALPSLAVEPVQPIAKPATPQKRKLFAGYLPPTHTSPFKTCQWIDGGSMTPKCGCKTVRGSSWCEHHYLRVFHRPLRDVQIDEAA